MMKRYVSFRIRLHLLLSAVVLIFLSTLTAAQGTYTGSGSVSRGLGTITTVNLFPGCSGGRVSALANITSTDSKVWVIPASVQFTANKFLPDLYNQCSGVTPSSISSVNYDLLPTVIIDSAGEVITGLIFGDNYYEMYVNGVLVGTDAVPYTPFNSSLVKFKVKRPYTVAFKLVDWEENIGVGTELNNGNPYHTGDGGFIARFSDGTITDTSWRAQTFYIAPVGDLSTVLELPDGTRSTASANTAPPCSSNCYAIHYLVPPDWNLPAFNDRIWPKASIFTPAQVGGNNPAYVNFASSWGSAQFIWSSNLLLDNLVLIRKTVGSSSTEIESEKNTLLKPKGINATVYPNPAGRTGILSVTLPETGPVSVDIVNIAGEELYNVYSEYAGSETVNIPVSFEKLSPGFYFLRVRSSGYTTSVKVSVVK